MKFDALTEWRKFKTALIQELRATPLAEFESAWRGRTEKTQFYGTTLLPRVAARLGYKLGYEHLRRDYVLLNSDHVPVVFMESENDHKDASHEIEKLCAVSSPVRVLFLSCDWLEGERAKYLSGWRERFATHHKYSGQDAVYMIAVGGWDEEILRYYIESFDVSGKEIEPQVDLVLSRAK